MTIDEKLKAALEEYNKFSPEQKAEHCARQRESWINAEAELDWMRKIRVVPIQALEEVQFELERLRNTLKRVRNMVVDLDAETGCCCCGDSVDNHGFGSGHAPVDRGDYYKDGIVAEIDRALGATE